MNISTQLITSKLIVILLVFAFTNVNSQIESQKGMFSIGTRSTISLFDHDKAAKIGYGVGGQFRVQILEKLNTEWFLDYLQQDLGSAAFRKDLHIGWSLMYYPWVKEKQLFKPYLVVGHCFDWSHLQLKVNPDVNTKKFSSAVQAGMGTHFNLSKRFDFTLLAQYMVHFGRDVELSEDNSTHIPTIKEHKHTDATGHLLITMGINYKLGKLWGRKK